MKKGILLFGILMLMVLTACSASGGEVEAATAQTSSGETAVNGETLPALSEVPSGETAADADSLTTLEEIRSGDTTVDSEVVNTPGDVQSGNTGNIAQLNEGYADALPVQTQLALGTMLLEDGHLAISGDQAAALLPMWQAVQILTASGTAADAEITAVFNQIQASMTTEQISAIADMQLTQEVMRSLVQEGTIAIDVGDVKRGSTEAASSDARSGGPPGGVGGALGGQADPARQGTRQAEGGGNNLLNQAVTSAVVQMLELKTT